MALVAIGFDQRWLVVVIAYGFLARVLTGPKLSPLGLLVTKVVTPRLPVPVRNVPGPPKRFAQGIGATVTTIGAVAALAFGADVVADVALAMIIVAAGLESIFAYCVGCKLFGVAMRAGLVPAEVCAECADIWGGRPGMSRPGA